MQLVVHILVEAIKLVRVVNIGLGYELLELLLERELHVLLDLWELEQVTDRQVR